MAVPLPCEFDPERGPGWLRTVQRPEYGPSAGDVENCVHLSRRFLQDLDGRRRRQNDQLNPTLFCLAPHIVHHREPPVGFSADDQAGATPGNVLVQRQRRMTEGIAEFFDAFFLRL
jgi:hypothetical protein